MSSQVLKSQPKEVADPPVIFALLFCLLIAVLIPLIVKHLCGRTEFTEKRKVVKVHDYKFVTDVSDRCGKQIEIKCLRTGVSDAVAKKATCEFSILAIEFGNVADGFVPFQQKVWINPRGNKEYGKGPGQTHWRGPLKLSCFLYHKTP